MSSFKLSVGDFLDKLESVASNHEKISMLEDVIQRLHQEKQEDEKTNQDPSPERESAIALFSSMHQNILQTMSSSSHLQPPSSSSAAQPTHFFTPQSSSSLQPPPSNFFTAPSSSSALPPTHFCTTPSSSSLQPPPTSFLPPQPTGFFTEPSSSSTQPPTHFLTTPPSSSLRPLTFSSTQPPSSSTFPSKEPSSLIDLTLRIGPSSSSDSFIGLDPPSSSSQPLLLPSNSPLPLPQLPTTFRPSVPSLSSLPQSCFQGPPSLFPQNKPAFHWTEMLKRRFDVAVMVLGGLNSATPTGIKDLMEEDVTVEQIGSFLQRASRAHVLNNQAEAVDHQVDALADHHAEAVDHQVDDALADHQDEAVDHQVESLADHGKRARDAEDQDKAEPSSKRNKDG